jgi:hypothetical protein
MKFKIKYSATGSNVQSTLPYINQFIARVNTHFWECLSCWKHTAISRPSEVQQSMIKNIYRLRAHLLVGPQSYSLPVWGIIHFMRTVETHYCLVRVLGQAISRHYFLHQPSKSDIKRTGVPGLPNCVWGFCAPRFRDLAVIDNSHHKISTDPSCCINHVMFTGNQNLTVRPTRMTRASNAICKWRSFSMQISHALGNSHALHERSRSL